MPLMQAERRRRAVAVVVRIVALGVRIERAFRFGLREHAEGEWVADFFGLPDGHDRLGIGEESRALRRRRIGPCGNWKRHVVPYGWQCRCAKRSGMRVRKRRRADSPANADRRRDEEAANKSNSDGAQDDHD
jgi:hypothetical protein